MKMKKEKQLYMMHTDWPQEALYTDVTTIFENYFRSPSVTLSPNPPM